MSGLAVPGRGNPGPWIGRSRERRAAPARRGCNLHRSKRKVNPPLLAGALDQGRGGSYVIVFPAPFLTLYVLTL